MKTAFETYRAELDAIREAGTYKSERIITTPQRSRIDTTAANGVVNMCANNYLGLSAHPRLIEAAKASYDKWLRSFFCTFHLRNPGDPQRAGAENRKIRWHGRRDPLLLLL